MIPKGSSPSKPESATSDNSISNVEILQRINYYNTLNLKNKAYILELQTYKTHLQNLLYQYTDDANYIMEYRRSLKTILLKIKSKYPQLYLNTPELNPSTPSIPKPTGFVLPPIDTSLLPKQSSFPLYPVEETTMDFTYTIESSNPFFNKHTVNLKFLLNLQTTICAIDFSPDGAQFSFASVRFLYIVNTINGQIETIADISKGVTAPETISRVLKYSPSADIIAVGIDPNFVGIFDLEKKSLVQTLNGHTRYVTALEYAPNSKYLISGGADGVICIWDLKKYRLIKKIQYSEGEPNKNANSEGAVLSIVANPKTDIFAVGIANGYVGLFNAVFDQVSSFRAHTSPLLSMNFVSNSYLITTSADRSVKLWQVSDFNVSMAKLFNEHENYVTCSCFSQNYSVFFTGSKDKSIKCWDYDNQCLLFTIKASSNTILNVSHHPQENIFIASSADGNITCWSYLMPAN